MAQLTGPRQVFTGPTTQVDDTTGVIPLGSIGQDTDGNEYIYLDFQQATNAGDWVVYDEAYLAGPMNTTALGPVAIAAGSPSASDMFGWAMIRGTFTGANGTSAVADNDVLAGAASLHVAPGATSTSGNLVIGAIARSAASTATSPTNGGATFTVQLTYPYVLGGGIQFSS